MPWNGMSWPIEIVQMQEIKMSRGITLLITP